MSGNDEITITLAMTETGQSDSISVGRATTTVKDLEEWSKALFAVSGNLGLFKDGKALTGGAVTLQQAGIAHGDLIAVQKQRQQAAPADPPAAPPAAAAASGGLDFTNLLNANAPAASTASSSSATGGLNFSNLINASASSSGVSTPHGQPPVYVPGMSLEDAMEHNPHPQNFVSLLLAHESLFKELNYHSPALAQKLQNKSLEECTAIWREELVRGGIKGAVASTETWQKERDYRTRLQQNPNDADAKQYFDEKERTQKVNRQYMQMMQEYPESMGRVLMLYIEAKVNGNSIQAFVDSGAQNTIMSKTCAEKCGIAGMIDTRFAGTAVGVGTGKILGRIHIVSLQIGSSFFPCSVTVMDDKQGLGDKNMEFLLGLDMLKRHTCQIDLEYGVVKFKLGPGQYMEAPFLHEKDLDETKGGTKGFDADKANQQLLLERAQRESEGADRMEEDDDDKKASKEK